jgi:flagella basal body P-ring formation protein FlgA
MLRVALLLIIAFTTSSPALAAEEQSLVAVRTTAEKHVLSLLDEKKKYFITAGQLDSRLRLAPCQQSLQASIPASGTPRARMTVEVRCPAPSWKLYIPVTIEVETTALVLTRPMSRDEHVTAADVRIQTLRLAGTGSTHLDNVEQLQRRHLKRPLAAGQPLTAEVLVPDLLVRRGQLVTLLFATDQMEIRSQGKALSDGGAEQRVRVQNLTSSRIVEGTVVSSDVVRVGGP